MRGDCKYSPDAILLFYDNIPNFHVGQRMFQYTLQISFIFY